MEKENIHAGHKKRLRGRFAENYNFSGFTEHEILEMLLSYSCVRKNTNELAHRLIKRFGSFRNVLDADFSELLETDGMGEQSAILITMQSALFRYYNEEKNKISGISYDSDDFIKYILSLFSESDTERMYMFCFGANKMLKSKHLLSRGNGETVLIDKSKMIRDAIGNKAKLIIFAHNHPNGMLVPSNSDIENTKMLFDIFGLVGIPVADHIIVAKNECISIMNDRRFELISGKNRG